MVFILIFHGFVRLLVDEKEFHNGEEQISWGQGRVHFEKMLWIRRVGI